MKSRVQKVTVMFVIALMLMQQLFVFSAAGAEGEGTSYESGTETPVRKWEFQYEGLYSSPYNAPVPKSPILGKDGTLYFQVFYSGASKLFELAPDGALQSTLDYNGPVVIGPDGTFYRQSQYNGYLEAVRPDGTTKWIFAHPSDSYNPPVFGPDGTIYMGSTDRSVYAVNPTDGTLKWEVQTGYVYSGPARGSDGTMYVIAGDSEIHLNAIGAGGVIRWQLALPQWAVGGTKLSIGPDGTIYLSSMYANKLLAVGTDGVKKWESGLDGTGYASPYVKGTDGTLYLLSNEKLYAISPDGSRKWVFQAEEGLQQMSPLQQQVLLDYQNTPVIGKDGTIYVGGKTGKLYGVDPAGGTVKWTFSMNAPLSVSPMVGPDGTIYAGSKDKNLYALHTDGTVRWIFQGAWGGISTMPVAGPDGSLYFASADGRLYAVEVPGTSAIADLTLNAIALSLEAGTKRQILATAAYTDGNIRYVTREAGYVSSDPVVAVVDDAGVINGLQEGSAVITVSYEGKTAVLNATVTATGNPRLDPNQGGRGGYQTGAYDWAAVYQPGVPGLTGGPSGFTAGDHPYLKWTVPSVRIPAIDRDGIVYRTTSVAEKICAPGSTVSCPVTHRGYLEAIDLDGTVKWSFKGGIGSGTSPVIGADGTIYWGSEGVLYAISPDGTKRWELMTSRYYMYSNITGQTTPVLGSDGTIYIVGGQGMFAVGSDGAKKWLLPWVTALQVPVIGADGTIYAEDSGDVHAINPDGSRRWSFGKKADHPPALGADGTIYLLSEGRLYALNPDGTINWSTDFGHADETRSGIRLSPISLAADGTLYMTEYYHSMEDGGDTSYSRIHGIGKDGVLKWSFSMDYRADWQIEPLQPVIDREGTIYAVEPRYYNNSTGQYENAVLHALKSDGTEAWSTPFQTSSSSPASLLLGADGTVYAVFSNGNIYAYGKDGTLLWSYQWNSSAPNPTPILGPEGTFYFHASSSYFSGKIFAVGTIEPVVTDIMLDSAAYNIAIGRTHPTVVSGRYSDHMVRLIENGNVTFSSSDPSVAAVDAEGIVTGVKAGEAVITADYQGITESATVSVFDNIAENLVFDADFYDLAVGDAHTTAVKAIYTDESMLDAVNTDVVFTTSDSAIAEVDLNGIVTGVGVGEAAITASYQGVTDTVTVSVYVNSKVTFMDRNLEQAVRDELDKETGDIYAADLKMLIELDGFGYEIEDLDGLEDATNLTVLDLDHNDIRDLGPLIPLLKLEELELYDNRIENITDLAGLTRLTRLDLGRNRIRDASAVGNLTRLTYLYLDHNPIRDISALGTLASLNRLYLSNNPIEDFTPISALTELTDLYLRNSGIEDISFLADMTKLTDLSLRNNQISDISVLSGLPALEYVYLEGNPLNGAAMDIILELQDRNVDVTYGDSGGIFELQAITKTAKKNPRQIREVIRSYGEK